MKALVKFFDKIIVFLLVIMGVFSSCNNDDQPVPEYGVIEPMYGVRVAKSVIIEEEASEQPQIVPVISESNSQEENIL
jgi:hypothetical protein